MKAHSEIEPLFADYDRLSRGEQQELEAHAAACADCAARLADYRRMAQDFARLHDPVASPRLDAAIRRALTQPQQPQRQTARRRPAAVLRYLAPAALLLALAAGWLLVRGGLPWQGIPLSRPGGSIPAARSALVESFVWQTDGGYGYQMLRPKGWAPVDESQTGGWRAFQGPDATGEAGSISMMVANLEVGNDVAAATRGEYAIGGVLLPLFAPGPTLDAWTASFEQEAIRGGALLQQVRALPDARIYYWNLEPAAGTAFMLIGLKVDAGRPLVVVAFPQGPYADLERLEGEGFLDDLATMVESARAIPADPRNVVPWLANLVPTAVSLPVPAVAGTPMPPSTRPAPAFLTPTPTATPAATSQPAAALPGTLTPGGRPLQP